MQQITAENYHTQGNALVADSIREVRSLEAMKAQGAFQGIDFDDKHWALIFPNPQAAIAACDELKDKTL